MTTIVLARHGQTAWHHPNRYTGRSDIPLDEVGERQAARLAGWAAGQEFSGLACSPLGRAVATMAPVAAAIGIAPTTDDRLRELDFGVAEGRTLGELRADDPELVQRFLADPARHHFPGGEPPEHAARRAVTALADLAAADPAGRVLVVAHNTLIRLVTCAVLGLPLAGYRRRLPALAPAALVMLSIPPGGDPNSAALVAYNVALPAGCDCHAAVYHPRVP